MRIVAHCGTCTYVRVVAHCNVCRQSSRMVLWLFSVNTEGLEIENELLTLIQDVQSNSAQSLESTTTQSTLPSVQSVDSCLGETSSDVKIVLLLSLLVMQLHEIASSLSLYLNMPILVPNYYCPTSKRCSDSNHIRSINYCDLVVLECL